MDTPSTTQVDGAQTVQRMKRSIRSHRGVFTKRKTTMEAINVDNEDSMLKMTALIATMKSTQSTILQLDCQITLQEELDDDAYDAEVEDQANLMDYMTNALTIADNKLTWYKSLLTKAKADEPVIKTNGSVKLPKISLPTISGILRYL